MDSNVNDETFEYLISQILNENCTPILGAGISYISKDKDDSSEDYHRTGTMIRKIAKRSCGEIKFNEEDKAVCDEIEFLPYKFCDYCISHFL
ncbi:MAG: hypothetical protein PWP54_1026 [Thermosipho sp. (in: thermotogales)]|nr:hypothetical protein [Thermosipho sp. (in: thermotogales)]MDN5325105.1 hypothetical protein [Thermosipho sp. (in: thermotogales)]